MLQSQATQEGTARYRKRHPEADPCHFRSVGELAFGSIGLGTYLGDAGAQRDAGYEEAIRRALATGCNVLDTAINYRNMGSERAVGRALSGLVAEGKIAREEVFVSTKGGFLAFDGPPREDPASMFHREYIEPGIATAADLAAGCHCIASRYISDQIGRSLRNLGLSTIDLYYLHNPETQLSDRSRAEFETELLAVFETLEREILSGRIARYGLATWTGFRVAPQHPEHLSLARILELADEAAQRAGASSHHLFAVELPLNLAMPEALTEPTQEWEGERVAFLEAAHRAGLFVATSASMLQGRLARGLTEPIRSALSGVRTDAQRALQFARSAPSVTTALVGMSSPGHVDENLELARVAPASPRALRSLFEKRN